ncbi:MAG: hypothetical protein HXX20_14730 [Chloroflexi bacterium]|nr:hypothetical protein [Chloroflexota bacterium]
MSQQTKDKVNWDIAEKMAADLCSERIDLNEAAKASNYLSNICNLEQFFQWLDRTNQSSAAKALIRSQQTQEYYRKLRDICNRRLKGLDIDEANRAFAWAVRLARFYAKNPRVLELEDPRKVEPVKASPAKVVHTTPAVVVPPPTVSKPAQSTPVKVGEKHTANVTKSGKTTEIAVSGVKADKDIRWRIRKAEAQGFELKVGQSLEVEVIEANLDETNSYWLIFCKVLAGSERKVVPTPTPQPKKSKLEEILERMQKESQGKV